jgi:hypothetical protein
MKMIVSRVEADLGHPIEIDEQAFSRIPSGVLKETESPKVSESPVASEELSLEESLLLLSSMKKDQVQSERLILEEDDSLSFLFADEN